MSRLLMGCGAVVDTLLSGMSLLGGGEQSWLAGLMIGGLTVVSPIAFYFVATATRALEQPVMLDPLLMSRK
jgi:hypothetical protein